MKTLEEFDFRQSPKASHSEIQELGTRDYIGGAEPVIFLGEPNLETFYTSWLHH